MLLAFHNASRKECMADKQHRRQCEKRGWTGDEARRQASAAHVLPSIIYTHPVDTAGVVAMSSSGPSVQRIVRKAGRLGGSGAAPAGSWLLGRTWVRRRGNKWTAVRAREGRASPAAAKGTHQTGQGGQEQWPFCGACSVANASRTTAHAAAQRQSLRLGPLRGGACCGRDCCSADGVQGAQLAGASRGHMPQGGRGLPGVCAGAQSDDGPGWSGEVGGRRVDAPRTRGWHWGRRAVA